MNIGDKVALLEDLRTLKRGMVGVVTRLGAGPFVSVLWDGWEVDMIIHDEYLLKLLDKNAVEALVGGGE